MSNSQRMISLTQGQPTIGTLAFLFISFIPIILPICLLIISSFNKDLKGFIFIVGLVLGIIILKGISYVLTFLNVSPQINSQDSTSLAKDLCNLYFLSNITKVPVNGIILGYTLMYFILSMSFVNKWNEHLMILLTLVFIADLYIYIMNLKCSNWLGYIGAATIGIIWSSIYVTIIHASNKELLYNYDIISNKEMCSRNFGNKKRFVCSKRKNIPKAAQAVS